ncbi:hypothetical protein FOA43_001810 [Brettanomyces nanus]|uniref:Uncharacterized protein n=1 Tax=Eeniella nana TaxID=13502 RepID=A0A875RP27_EENNA|nr:uncharacterized protein FOA43_001810 [Brettanomyces nanus]QPG74480.1 hypothetical protein FOA43_001810 [Brettanomyces nanus]
MTSIVGLENLFKKVKDCPIGLWVLNCFFYNNALKVMKVTTDNKVGTLYPLSEYQKVILFNFDNIEHSMEVVFAENSPDISRSLDGTSDITELMEPVMRCCIGLFFRLGEVNNLYDIFIAKIRELVDTWKPLSIAMKGKSEAFKLEFSSSPRYRRYEDLRVMFHDWIEIHAD